MAGWEYLSNGFGQTNPKNILKFLESAASVYRGYYAKS